MSKVSAKYSIKRFNELYSRTLDLPKQIITTEDFSEEETKQKEYEQKKLIIQYNAQEICLETRSLIKLIYGHESEYLSWVNRIAFTSESKGLIINTYNTNHNKYWQIGKNELISLISNIISEEEERMRYEQSLIDRTTPVKYAVAVVLFVIFMLATWTAPPDTFSLYFERTKILPVRICISLIFSCLLAIIPFKDYWKELLFSGLFGIVFVLIGLLKPDQIENETKKIEVTKPKPVEKTKTGT